MLLTAATRRWLEAHEPQLLLKLYGYILAA